MKGEVAKRTRSAMRASNDGRRNTHVLTFSKVIDGRKQPIRGLWIRGSRYYAQLRVENPINGSKRAKRIPLVDKDGKAVTTAPQAVAEMARLKVKRADNDLPTLRRAPKFAEYATEYLDGMKAGAGTKKASSIAKDKSVLANWVEHVGQLRLDQIKPTHVRSFITKRLKDGLKPRTVNLDVISLRGVLKQARTDGLIQRLPLEGFKPLKVTTPKRPFFSSADIDRICAAAFEKKKDSDGKLIPVTKNAQQFADYLRLLAYSGARRNEALALRWDDVDFKQEQLTIGATGDTKNSEARTVDFNAKLKAHLLDMRPRYSHNGTFISEWLFPSPQRGDKDASTKTFKESLWLARAQAKLPRFNFHDCRHHFISMCVMSGIDYMTIAAWVGHKDGGVLIGKVYGHLANEHRQAMAAKLSFEPAVQETAVNQ